MILFEIMLIVSFSMNVALSIEAASRAASSFASISVKNVKRQVSYVEEK